MPGRRIDRLLELHPAAEVAKQEVQLPLVLLVTAWRTARQDWICAVSMAMSVSRVWTSAFIIGGSDDASPSSSQNICRRVVVQKPRRGITGEPCSQPPLGVAEIRFPHLSATSMWQVSPFASAGGA